MTPNSRKYGEKQSRPLPIWNGVFDHYGRIGDALWEFLWCIDAVTSEKDGVGSVLGGAPVKITRIVADLREADKETVRRHLKQLADEKYIRARRTPYGQVIEVLNSKKFDIWKKEKPQNAVSPPPEKHIYEREKHIHEREKPQNAVSKEDSAVTQQKDAAATSPSVWEFLGVDGTRWPGEVREVCKNLYASKNGEAPVEFIGTLMDGVSAIGARIPRELAQRATLLRSQFKARDAAASAPAPFTPLPENPFQERDWTLEELCPKEN